MPTKKICAVIVTYNGMRWLEKCLGSIVASEVKADIFVVDNGSTDGTLEFLKNYQNLSFLHESEKNLGFGKANNIALRHGFQLNYEYYLLLNQDAWIEKDVIGELKSLLESNQHFGILSPFHLNGEGDSLDLFFQSYLTRTPSYQEDLKKGNSIRELHETPFVNAACWLLKKETLEKVGVFHPLFDHYGEDDNYIDRLHHKDLKLGIATRLKVYHDRETGGMNPIKDDPFKLFKRTLLQRLLRPGEDISRIEGFWLAFKLSKKFSKHVAPFYSRVVFRFWCIINFFKIFQDVNAFHRTHQFELKID